jgi:hypothetical protein
MFTSAEEAKQFARRHAEAIGVDGERVEDSGYWLLSTTAGNYFIARIYKKSAPRSAASL